MERTVFLIRGMIFSSVEVVVSITDPFPTMCPENISIMAKYTKCVDEAAKRLSEEKNNIKMERDVIQVVDDKGYSNTEGEERTE